MTDHREPRPRGWAIRKYPDDRIGGVAFNCPGCGSDSYVPIGTSDGWTWDGSEEKPTLRPSLLQRCCGWHGYLTAGELIPC